ncbi:uncharacterized protein [Diadema setosum]|uniref:uncharacterized protein n=1 Tax=Diadema setosum TaxID=31175 RepID=UPI003B3B3C80
MSTLMEVIKLTASPENSSSKSVSQSRKSQGRLEKVIKLAHARKSDSKRSPAHKDATPKQVKISRTPLNTQKPPEGKTPPRVVPLAPISGEKKAGVIIEGQLPKRPLLVTTPPSPKTPILPGVRSSSMIVVQKVQSSPPVGVSTPPKASLGTVLPPTPPNEPVPVPPMVSLALTSSLTTTPPPASAFPPVNASPQAVPLLVATPPRPTAPLARPPLTRPPLARSPLVRPPLALLPRPSSPAVRPPLAASPVAQVIPAARLQVILPSSPQVLSMSPAHGSPAARPQTQSPTVHLLSSMSPQILTPPHPAAEKPIASIPPLRKLQSPAAQSPSELPAKEPVKPVNNLDKGCKNSGQTSCADSPRVDGDTPGAKPEQGANQRAEDDEDDLIVVDDEKPKDENVIPKIPKDSSINEEVQEVLSSLKRKAASSPCSNLLKIKCEKIDAVVRINKTREDLYRAERGPENCPGPARRGRSSAAEQGCFFNVVERERRLGICPCGRANSYDAMIACDNPRCTVEWYHFTCVGVTKVPKDEWFCPFCSEEAAEVLRRKNEKRREKRRRKKEAEARRKKLAEAGTRNKAKEAEEEGLCPCGQPNSWDRMIACDGKDCSVEWYHFKCVDVTSAPDSEWLCMLCRDSSKEANSSPYVRRRRRYRPIRFSIYGENPDSENEADAAGKTEDDDWSGSEGGSSSGSGSGSESEGSAADGSSEEWAGGRQITRRTVQARGQSVMSYREDEVEEEDFNDEPKGGSSDADLTRSKRSRRKRHKKIDLDFEDGSQFDDGYYDSDEILTGYGESRLWQRRKRKISPSTESTKAEQGVACNSVIERDHMYGRTSGKSAKSVAQVDESATAPGDKACSDGAQGSGGECSTKAATESENEAKTSMEPSDTFTEAETDLPSRGEEEEEDQEKKKKEEEEEEEEDISGRFLIHQCELCGQDFIVASCKKTADSKAAGIQLSTHCPTCVKKSRRTSSSSGGGNDADAGKGTSPDDAERRREEEDGGHAGGTRSTRYRAIVSCKVCGMGYHTRVALLIHMKAKHLGHLGNFECAPCDKLFVSQEECQQHLASVHHI